MKTPIKIAALALGSLAAFSSMSCNRKEKVLDIKTPGGSIEVERDKKSGEVDIQVDEKK
ncbi:hypothetical protein OKA04_01555 [Luteolibacter flavescens]|uniref:Lipoprotein n=1 Tax=Luteolibacter flavescens TaxID=1859460 RepID=A0ABT3FIL0_9BACT|nr:hypothetical protein [Luteolibacter flavescens]MCW1883395.1 hypothetical protein [Luteolibacter flavescens]